MTAVISMARSLKLRVVAEGVETPEEPAFLQAHQCDEAQGYYFSRPVPPQQFAGLLKTGIQKRMVVKAPLPISLLAPLPSHFEELSRSSGLSRTHS